MASDLSFVEYICDQINDTVTFKKMFGEYALYCDGKVVALVCDNQLFVKPTEAGRSLIHPVVEAPPYSGAKNYFLIGDRLDDRAWITDLIQTTARELPLPKPKKPKADGKRKG
jgi:DNA transformation protein and related proteins